MLVSLNDKRVAVLRQICRAPQGLSAALLDGRITRPLLARGLVTISDDHIVTATDAGRRHLEQLRSEQPRRRRKPAATGSAGRASAILRAVEQLEEAIPPEAEVRVGIIQAAADDVLEGFRTLAQAGSRRGSQPHQAEEK